MSGRAQDDLQIADLDVMDYDSSGLDVDPAFFEDREADMSFAVHTSQIDAAARALERALPRLQLVTYDGREFADHEALRAEGDGYNVTNARFFGETEGEGESLRVYVDT